MPHFYTVIENQLRQDGSYGLLYDHYYDVEGQPDAYARAQAKYFTVCAAAALSGIPYHAAMLIQDDLIIKEQAVWDRRTAEETAEPVEE